MRNAPNISAEKAVILTCSDDEGEEPIQIIVNRKIQPVPQEDSEDTRLDWSVLDCTAATVEEETIIGDQFKQEHDTPMHEATKRTLREYSFRQDEETGVVELTEAVDDEGNPLSEDVLEEIQTAFMRSSLPFAENIQLPDEELKDIAQNLMQPYLKAWLEENMAQVVEETVQSQVQRILHRQLRRR